MRASAQEAQVAHVVVSEIDRVGDVPSAALLRSGRVGGRRFVVLFVGVVRLVGRLFAGG